ncbi:MAG: hypothetical protein Q8R11_02405 [bacterium]|nr:hypothetical protein [bacterium]
MKKETLFFPLKKGGLFFLASILCTLPLLIPLLTNGMLVSEDGPAHLVRQEAFTQSLLRGEIFPRWVPELNFGFGSPLFLYNWILPYYVGSFIQILFHSSALVALKWTLALGVILTALTTFLWLRHRFGNLAGLLGTIIMVWVPYRILTIYERATPGELWLTIFPPLILWLYDRNGHWSRVFLPLAWAGMFLTHNVGSLMFTPVILLLTFLRQTTGFAIIIPFLLGLLLTSFNWIPGMFESKLTTNVGTNLIASSSIIHANIANQTMQWWFSHPFEALTIGPRSLAIGFTIPFIGLISLIGLIRNKQGRHKLFIFYGILFIAFFLMTPFSLWFWRHIPLMTSILYPWRLVNIIILISTYLAAWWLTKTPQHTRSMVAGACIMLAIAGVIPSLSTKPRFVPLKPNWLETTWPDVVGEYLPKGITYERLEQLSSSINFSDRGKIVRGDHWVGLNQLWFPGWKTTAADIDLVIRRDFPGREGLLTVEVPESTDVRFSFTETPLRFLSIILSILGIALWLWQVGRVGQMHRRFLRSKVSTLPLSDQ